MKEKLRHLDIALICLRAINGQEVRRNHVLDNIHHPGSEEEQTMPFSNAALNFIIDINIASNEGSQHKVLVTLFARLLIMTAPVFANGRPSCRVTHRAR